MAERELSELTDLTDAVEARLAKAEALLMVIRSTSTSTISEKVMRGSKGSPGPLLEGDDGPVATLFTGPDTETIIDG